MLDLYNMNLKKSTKINFHNKIIESKTNYSYEKIDENTIKR